MSNPLDDLISEDDLKGSLAMSRLASNGGNLTEEMIGRLAREIVKRNAEIDKVSNGYDQIRALSEAAAYLLLTLYATGMSQGKGTEVLDREVIAITRMLLGSVAIATQGMARVLITNPNDALKVEANFQQAIKEKDERSAREVLHEALLLNNLDAAC